MDIRVRALSEFWSANTNSRLNERFRETGLLGSLRWWYEALIRALGCYACDPTDDDTNFPRCPVKIDNHNKIHCAACELFGCTGHQRKFALRVCDDKGTPVDKQLEANKEYIWRFIPLREVDPVEWFLLERVIKMACDYASFGAKNVLKPSDHGNNDDEHHKDFGLFKWIKTEPEPNAHNLASVMDFLNHYTKNSNDSFWPNLRYFWTILGFTLDRKAYDEMLKFDSWQEEKDDGNTRPAYKNLAANGDNPEPETWLRGFSLFPIINNPNEDQIGKDWESKKIFSFHVDNAKRTWGYTQAKTKHWDSVTKLFAQQTDIPELSRKIQFSDKAQDYFGLSFPLPEKKS